MLDKVFSGPPTRLINSGATTSLHADITNNVLYLSTPTGNGPVPGSVVFFASAVNINFTQMNGWLYLVRTSGVYRVDCCVSNVSGTSGNIPGVSLEWNDGDNPGIDGNQVILSETATDALGDQQAGSYVVCAAAGGNGYGIGFSTTGTDLVFYTAHFAVTYLGPYTH